MKRKKKRKINFSRLAIKILMCLIYMIVIGILSFCSYQLYQEKNVIKSWQEVENVEDYTFIKINRMSEKFAYFEETNVGIHFAIEIEKDGLWRTYLVAIDEDDYNDYKKIIDYSYERIEEEPTPKKVYGYPVIVNEKLKALAIKNISNFVPAENEVVITEDNYETYLSNSYLDTTKKKQKDFSVLLFLTLLLILIVLMLLIATIFNKDKIVDKVDNTIDKEMDRARFMFEKQKKKKKKE